MIGREHCLQLFVGDDLTRLEGELSGSLPDVLKDGSLCFVYLFADIFLVVVTYAAEQIGNDILSARDVNDVKGVLL